MRAFEHLDGVVLGLGLPWQTALSAVAGSGIAVGVLSLSGARAFLMRLLPSCIRISLACGIGIFMSYIGLQSVGIIVANEFTLTQLNGFTSSNPDFFKIWAGIACTFLTAVLMTLRFPGAVLAGIAFGTAVVWADVHASGFDPANPAAHPSRFCYPLGVIGHNNERLYPYLVNATSRETALAPGGAELRGGCTNASFVYYPTALVAPASCPHVCGAVSFKGVFRGFGSAGGGGGGGEGQPPILRAWAGVVLIMLFTITLDSTGTFFALGKLGGLLDPATLALPPPAEDAAFLSVAASNVLSAGLGMSPSMTFLESATGIVAGGRTGLTAVFTGILFLVCMPFAPLLSQIPPLAYGPTLLIIGVLMIESIRDIDWDSMEDALPSFVCILFIPLSFNISDGLVTGYATWLALQLALAPFRAWRGEDVLVKFRAPPAGRRNDGPAVQLRRSSLPERDIVASIAAGGGATAINIPSGATQHDPAETSL